MKFFRILLAAIAISFFIAPDASACLIGYQSYGELSAKSDLIVIAHPVAKTADTDEKTYFPDIAYAGGSKVPAIGVETKFEVSTVLKGDTSLKQFVLHHLRLPDGEGESQTGCSTGAVSFEPEMALLSYRNYLLFLIREKDGRYAFAGRMTNVIDAVPYSKL